MTTFNQNLPIIRIKVGSTKGFGFFWIGVNKACVGSVVVSKQEGFRLFGANLTSPLPLLPLARFLLVCSEIFCRVQCSGRGEGVAGFGGRLVRTWDKRALWARLPGAQSIKNVHF